MENIACRRFGYEIKDIDNYRTELSIAIKKVLPTLITKYKKSEQEIMQDEILKNELLDEVYKKIKVGPSDKKSKKYLNKLHLNLNNN